MSGVVLKELGKWLLDVAKFVATAVILSTVFSGIKGNYVLIIGVLCVGAALSSGLFLIKKSEKS